MVMVMNERLLVLMFTVTDDEDELMDLQVFLEGGGEEASRLVDEAGKIQVGIRLVFGLRIAVGWAKTGIGEYELFKGSNMFKKFPFHNNFSAFIFSCP